MPTLFEPCGITQLESMSHATPPLVRLTGGLADTITDFNEETKQNETANGFSFEEYTPRALLDTIRRAVQTFATADWHTLMTRGMRQDWSWTRSAREYVEMYEETLAKAEKKQPAETHDVR